MKPSASSLLLKGAVMLLATLMPGDGRQCARADSDQRAIVILSPQSARVLVVATELNEKLTRRGYASTLVTFPARAGDREERDTQERLRRLAPALVVAGGARATTLALEATAAPVVFFLLPNARDAHFMHPASPYRKRVAGVTTDIRPDAQIARLLALAPHVRRLGVLHSDRTRQSAEAIRAAGYRRGLDTTMIETTEDHFVQATGALAVNATDAVVMVPDAAVYSSHSVQRLLLWGIKQRVVVWAFSGNVVRAGAVGGQFVDRSSITKQTAELVERVVAGADVGTIGVEYPRAVEEAYNERTAGLIGLSPSWEALRPVTVRYGSTP